MVVVKDKVSGARPVKDNVPNDNRPIWEIILELSAGLSHEEWAALPTDGAINYRHYLYGQPKRDYPEPAITEPPLKDVAA